MTANAVGDERGRVVDQALALDQRDEPSRQPEPRRDRGRRDGVGGRDDRADHEADRPGEAAEMAKWQTAATVTIVASTSPTESKESGRSVRRRSRSDVKNAAE